MTGETTLTLLSAATLVVAVVVLIVAVIASRSARRAVEQGSARAAAEQAEILRWVTGELGSSMDRFHAQLANFGQHVVEAQGSAGEAVQRSVHREMHSLGTSVNAQLASSQQSLGQGLASATETFGALQSRLGEVSDLAARMAQLAASVNELGSILKVPKLRGLMGEQTLELALRQVLPENLWSTQYRFADGRVVDAVVTIGDRLLPVDAKFPLEAFRRLAEAKDDASRAESRRELTQAVRVRINEIADRYINPAEGTTDFALMFIPAEGVYAEIVGGGAAGVSGILDEALGKKVVPVSPATVFAFLSVVAAGMRGLGVEARARELVGLIAAAEQEISRLTEELAVLGRHLHNASQRHVEVEARIAKVGERLREVGRHV